MGEESFWGRNRHWAIFAVMSSASLLSYFHQVGLATVSGDVARAFGADAAALGLLSAAFSYPYAAMQLPAGLLSDSLGPRKSVTLLLVLAAAGTALFAGAWSLGSALAARVAIGLGIGVIAVPLMKLTAVWFPPGDFGRVTALSFTVGGAGFWFATTPMAYAAAGFGWRTPFWALAAMTLGCALLVWAVVRDAPAGKRAAAGAGTDASAPPLRAALGRILSSRRAWLLGVWFLLQTGVYFSFVGLWGGQYLMRALGMPATDTGWILSPASCALMTAPLFTWMAERAGRRRLLIALPLLTALLAVPLVTGAEGLPPWALCALFLALAMTSIGGSAVLIAAGVELFPVSWSGTMSGFINTFPLVGGAILQQSIGALTQALIDRGYTEPEAFPRAFTLYCAAGLVAAALAWMYREQGADRTGADRQA